MNKNDKRKKLIIAGIAFLGVVLFFVLAGISYHKLLRYKLFPKRWGEVKPGLLFRSGWLDPALMEKTLRKHNIKTIVNLVGPSEKGEFEKEVAKKLGIEIHYFGMSGGGRAENPDLYPKAIKVAFDSMEASKPVLVHCSAGSQRAGTFVAIYQLLVEKLDSKSVLNEMFAHNFDGDPELIQYINDNMPFFARRLKELGVIDKIPDSLPVLKIE